MTTLRDAIEEDDWEIEAKLVSKRIFFKKHDQDSSSKIVLILLFIDAYGQPFEMKVWSSKLNDRREKIFTVYRKMVEDEFYSVTPTMSGQHQFRDPNEDFSSSISEYSGGWWIAPIDEFRMFRYLDCHTNIGKAARQMNDGPVNILANFLSLKKGPIKYPINGEPSIQGYFVRLSDDEGRAFMGLVWHTVNIDKSNFPLLYADRDDTVLLTSARPSTPPSSAANLTCVTTIYSPVVNSACVSAKRIRALKAAATA